MWLISPTLPTRVSPVPEGKPRNSARRRSSPPRTSKRTHSVATYALRPAAGKNHRDHRGNRLEASPYAPYASDGPDRCDPLDEEGSSPKLQTDVEVSRISNGRKMVSELDA